MVDTYSHKAIDAIRDEYTADQVALISEYRDYADGVHYETLSQSQRNLIATQKTHGMADNVLRLILAMHVSRVVFMKWEVDEKADATAAAPSDSPAVEEAAKAGPVEAFLDDLMMRNRVPELQYDVHWGMFRDGDYVVSQSWRGRVGLHREPWWDGDQGVFLVYGADREKRVGVREWNEFDPNTGKSRKRRTVYYPDRYIRYERVGKGWRPITTTPADRPDLEIKREGVVPWVKRDRVKTPLGIPMVHFANGSRRDTPYGLSEFTGLLAMQDDANSMQHDITLASKFTGAQMVWVAGAQSGGKLKVGPGMLLEMESPQARAGAIPPGDMTALTGAHSYKRQTMAINSQTPINQITGKEWPSGEAVLQMSMPAVAKATRTIIGVGPRWTEVGHQSTEIANAFGNLNLDENAPITSIMDDPRQIDEFTKIKMQHELARTMETISRIPEDTLLKQLEFLDKEVIDALIAERKALGDVTAPASTETGTGEEDDESELEGQF